MSHSPELFLRLFQFLSRDIKNNIHLISESALCVKFVSQELHIKDITDNSIEDNENQKSLPIAIDALKSYLVKSVNIEQAIIIDTVLSYDTLLIHFNLAIITGRECKERIEVGIKKYINDISNETHKKTSTKDAIKNANNRTTIEVPTYYGQDVGWDLNDLSLEKNLTIDDIILIHSQKTYTVCAIGFNPGFAFMGFVNPKIQHKRLTNPRTHVFPGSIGIAEDQTGIYPDASPGGWNIIARTPITLTDLNNTTKPCVFSVGDTVRFVPINKEIFLKLGGEIDTQ